MRALMTDKFYPVDTPDTYEKRVRIRVEAMPFADALPILYSHLPENLELRLKIANPADLNAFFTQLNDKWLEAGGPAMATQAIQQFSQRNEALEKFADIDQRLGYTGNMFDPIAIYSFIENGLRQTRHVRKVPLNDSSNIVYMIPEGYAQPAKVRKTYVTKSTPKKAASKSARHCSNCGKTGHTKTNCSKGKKAKKVNFINQSELEESESEDASSSEEQSSEEEESSDEESEIHIV